jgi:putative aldouronate transport system substrate-binding protein
LLEEVPSRLTDVTTDEGYIAVAAQLLSDDYMPNAGMVIRQDYLDAVGMESPVTYDQWEEVLTAFKTELNVESPLNIPSTAAFFGDYIGAGFGVSTSGLGIYVVDGVVHAGAIEDGYRQWVELLHDWYSEGLIYKDFYSEDSMQTYPDTSRVLSGEIGIWFVDVDTMAEYAINAAEANSPDFHVVGVADPVQNEGDVNHLRKYSDADANLVNTGNGIVVTTACKNPELAAMWLDAHYSPEGSLIVNYGGIEGETYNYDSDGKPVMTDLIVNNPDLAFNKALSFYCAKNYVGYYEYQRVSSIHTEDQLQATAVWALADSAYGYPVNANMTADEATEYAQYSSDLETYISEHIVKFIIGAEDLSNYESFQQELRNMGIERLVELKQAAYDRYISRA